MSKESKSNKANKPSADTPDSQIDHTPLSTRRGVGGEAFFLPVIAVIIIAGVLLVKNEEELLLRSQELNLWLPTGAYWNQLAQYPGAVASWVACYLTQFFYYPWLGTGILCGLWVGISLLTVWVYNQRKGWMLLSLLVPLALLAAFTQTGYWIYYQKLQGHLLVPTVGVLVALLSLCVHRLLRKWWLQLPWLIVWTVCGYAWFGAWGLGGTALICGYAVVTIYKDAVTDFKGNAGSIALNNLIGLTGILLIVFVPQFFYQSCYEMTEKEFIYRAALPSFRYSKDVLTQYYWPYYGLMAAFAVATIQMMLQGLLYEKTNTAAADTPKHKAANRHGMGWRTVTASAVPLVLVLAAIVGVSKVWYRDVNFHKELAMNRAVEELDWERVLQIARDGSTTVKPTRMMVMFRNLALFRLGRAGNEMCSYPEGAEQQNAPWIVRMTQVGGKLVYYHYGKANFCYRWCMEDGVEFGWKAETLKFMARTSLLNHEWEAARKYLRMLSMTTFHRKWAKRYASLLDRHDAFDLNKAEASVKAGKPLLTETEQREFLPIMHLMTYPDRLDGDSGLIELYLINTFAHGGGLDPVFQEASLIFALQLKDIPTFWPHFEQYARLHPGQHMPIIYQQAAYLYGMLEPFRVDISHMPFDESVINTYKRFMEFNDQCGAMDEQQKAKAFYPMFGDTFFYYYFLVRNQRTN
ncbi:MAG: hypothetical protein J5486_05770 [Bacteroidaceae bacterium]|nr:hypothetical protein [Bacteroidaceae bacterium]